jgi:hypothetical protein
LWENDLGRFFRDFPTRRTEPTISEGNRLGISDAVVGGADDLLDRAVQPYEA